METPPMLYEPAAGTLKLSVILWAPVVVIFTFVVATTVPVPFAPL